MRTLMTVLVTLVVGFSVGFGQTLEQKKMFLDSVNKYRVQAGLHPYEWDYTVDSLCKIRVQTIKRHLDSLKKINVEYSLDDLHYNFVEDGTKFNREVFHVKDSSISPASECTAKIFSFYTKDSIAHITLFNGWKNSPPHWSALMDPNHKSISLYFKKIGSFYYAVLIASQIEYYKKSI